MSKKKKDSAKTPETPKHEAPKEADPIKDFFKVQPVTATETKTHLELASEHDDFLMRRIELWRNLSDQIDPATLVEIRNGLLAKFGRNKANYINALHMTPAVRNVEDKEAEGLFKFGARLLYIFEYSDGYVANDPDFKAGEVPLTSNELRERLDAFCALLHKAICGFLPVFHWAMKEGVPHVSFRKV